MKRLLLTAAAMILVALPSCSDAVAPPGSDPDPVVGDSLLAGAAGSPAIDAIVDKVPTAASDGEVDGDFIRSRLAAAVAPSATVRAVNDALLEHGARITASVEGTPFLVLRIPPVANEAAAHALSAALVATGAFLYVKPEYRSPIKQARVLPASADSGISHLVPGRLPAAWNVKHIADTEVRVMVPDWYHQFTPMPEITALEFPSAASMTPSPGVNHGFHVAGIIAADHDASPFTGVFPRASLIDVDGLSMHNLGWQEMSMAMYHAYPATGNFLLSTSLGYKSGPTNDSLALIYAIDALHWRILVANDVGRFLHLTAASNEGDLAGIPGQAFSSSPYNLARFQGDLYVYVNDLTVPGVLKRPFYDLSSWANTNVPAAMQASPNLLSVGSSSRAGVETFFSSRGSDVRAVGEQVFAPCVVIDPDLATSPDTRCDGTRARYSGTSMATPLVAGIAAYLWSLEPSLTPVQLRDILQDAYNSAWTEGVLDAYHAVLRLDDGLMSAPVRRALLDVATAGGVGNDDGFDEHDIAAFRASFGSYGLARQNAGNPALTDHSRYDLNGDGITGDTLRFAPFDLDADGVIGGATRVIEGAEREFDEARVSDLAILCYYVYSSLYQGDPDERRDALPGCVPPVEPPPPPPQPIPEGTWSIESDIFFSGAGIPFPSPACQPGDTGANGFLPLFWTWTVPCTAGSNALTATGSARDLGTGSGQASVSVSGQFQSGSGRGTGTGSVQVDTRQFFRVSAPGHHYEQNGSMRIVIRRKIALSIPAFPITCAHHEKAGQARGELQFGGVEFTARVDRACVIDHGPATLTQEVTDTLPAMQFKYMRVSGIEVRIRSNVFVGLPGGEAFAGSAHVEYQILEFLDLPPGAIVETYGGGTWPQPAIGPAAGSAVSTQGTGRGPAGTRSARSGEPISSRPHVWAPSAPGRGSRR